MANRRDPRLFVDYTSPLADLIKACGFDWVNGNITEKTFPITQRPNGNVEMRVFRFHRAISSDEAVQEMGKEGYRPAELPEGLAYAKANPDEQRQYQIALLGSAWRGWGGDRGVPYLWYDSGGRGLNFGWYGSRWDEDVRFLAVRKF